MAVTVWLIVVSLTGCARLQFPAIDPTGERIFLPAPNSTTILTPNVARDPLANSPSASLPTQPAFSRPADPPDCCGGPAKYQSPRHVIPKPSAHPSRGQSGEIILTPSRIIAPVGAEVVVLAGICGSDYHFVMNQPLEWLLSSDSVGQFIEVDGLTEPVFNRLVPPSPKKFDGNYAWGRTGLKHRLLTRGTPTPVDDIELLKGHAFVSLSSESEGTSYITCVAPNAQAWDKRRKSTIVHWIDAVWSIPVPKSAAAGTVTPLTTLVTRNSDSGGVEGWTVNYSIVGGAAAEFAPTGSQTAEVRTNSAGQAIVQIRQVAGQFDPGTTQVRVDVVRPKIFGESELKVESGITSVTWSAPALKIRAIGPRSAGVNEAFNYRVEITNPGDQLTRDVILRTQDFPDNLEFVSSTPQPNQFGRQLEWRLGDIAVGSQPLNVDIQLKSNTRGQNELCFEVSSATDQLKTEACAQTEISAPCLGLQLEGPNAAKVGEQATYDIIIVNQCADSLEGIQLQIQYDPGLAATGLGNPIRADVGTLKPGEKVTRKVVFDVIRAGEQCFNLSVTAIGGHSARANECIAATPTAASTVDLELTGQRRIDRGGRILIQGKATNVGNIPLNSVTVTNRFSDSLEPQRVTQQFPHRWLGNTGDELIFDLGSLDPGQSKTVDVVYDALTEDGDAFSEMTVSSPDVSPVSRRYDLRIEPPGTVGDQPAAEGESGGVVPDRPPVIPGEGPIGIPEDADAGRLNAQMNLAATARTLDRQTAVNGRTRVEFEIRNGSSISDTNVEISLLVPPSLQLDDLVDDLGKEVPIVSRSPDFTLFYLEPRREMRAGDSLTYVASFSAVQPGQSVVEIQATSDNSAGTITASDSIVITP